MGWKPGTNEEVNLEHKERQLLYTKGRKLGGQKDIGGDTLVGRYGNVRIWISLQSVSISYIKKEGSSSSESKEEAELLQA